MTRIANDVLLSLKQREPAYDWDRVSAFEEKRDFLLGIEVFRFLYEVARQCGFEHRTWKEFCKAYGSSLRNQSRMPSNHERRDSFSRNHSLTERTKGISGEDGSSCKYHPDEIVRTYFYYGSNAGQRLSRSPNAEHFKLLCKDWRESHEVFAQLAIQDEKWRQGVRSFVSKILSVWKDERAELLSRAYNGTTLRHVLMQYVAIDENIAPVVMFKQAVWIISNNKSADEAEVALGLYDATERLFYELGARPVVYTRQMLFEDDAFGEFGKARNQMARDSQFSEGKS